MNKTYLLVLALFAVAIAQDLDSKRPLIKDAITPYSGVFAASWLGGFCFKSTRCDKEHLALWDKYTFFHTGSHLPFMDFGQVLEPMSFMLISMSITSRMTTYMTI